VHTLQPRTNLLDDTKFNKANIIIIIVNKRTTSSAKNYIVKRYCQFVHFVIHTHCRQPPWLPSHGLAHWPCAPWPACHTRKVIT